MTYSFSLMGEMPSKKNAWRHAGSKVYLAGDVQDSIDDMIVQLKVQARKHKELPLTTPVRVFATFFITKDKDLDNIVTSLCDCLQTAGVVKNDKQVVSMTISKMKRASGPRTLLEVSSEV